MDKDTKTKMLLDMQEHPEQFAEQELKDILNDVEAQEGMEATALLKRAMKNEAFSMSEQEVEAEWQGFATKHFAPQKPQRNWLKVAAAFVGILIVTGIAYAAVQIISNRTSDKDVPSVDEKQTFVVPSTSDDTMETDTVAKASVVFDNVALDSIAKEISSYYHVAVDVQNEQAKQLRFYFVWKQEDSLHVVVEKLNMFESVHLAIEDKKLIVK